MKRFLHYPTASGSVFPERCTLAHVALRYILPLLVFWLVCGQLRAAIINVPADYATISLAVAAASPGDEIVVAPGTYNENVIINTNNLTLRSSGGKAVTTIQGSAGVLGTILIQANGITIGGLGQGFTIKGYDNPSPAIEYAAIYIQGVRSNITIRGNEIVADGEAGLLSEFGNAVNNLVVSGNVFSGKTFVGPEAGDCGFANQFTAPNVPRQLVNIPTGSTITFTSNEITGTAGSSSSSSDPVCATFGQGNTLVTIDANNATIRGNTFAGTTTRFGHSLRVRGTGANISCNTFDNTGLGLGCVHIFFNATALGSLGTPNTLAGVADANVFVNEGAYFTGATQIYRSAAQVLAIPQTPILANSTPFPPVTNVNTGEIFCSIQSAIDDPFTLNGHTLSVAAGTYKEIVTVSKSLTILGPNAAINPCTGTRVAEAILMPPASQPFYDGATEVILMEVQAADVTVKGLTFDGDNPALTNSDGGPIDAADGLDVFSNVGGLLVENNIFKNLNEGGVTGYPSGVPAQTNNTVIHNRFENIPGDVGTGYPLSGYGISVLIYNNFYTNVEENCMDEVRIGVQTGNYHLADPGSSRNIKNNQIQSKAVGIFHNLHYSNASPFTVEDNTISADDPGNTGIILWSFQGSAGSTVKNNVISGGTWGIEFWNNPTSSTITVEGGSITGAGTGVLATNYSTYGDAASTTVAIKGVTISGSTVRAVHVEDSPSNTNGATIALQIKDDCDVVGTGTLTGVLVDGADASALIQNNNASIHGFAVGIDVNGGTATITGNHIYDNGIGIRFRNSGSGSVTNNDFTGTTHNGTDLRLDATAGTVNADGDNHFAGINFGVDNQSAAVVDAENNYWNHPSGPSAPPQAFGTGAKISNNVDYCPFYGAPGGPALPASACACGSACPAPVTFTGNITISTQAQMDAFKNSSGCKYTHVTGNLTIDGNGNASTGADVAGSDPITDLCNLQELLSVGGNLVIRDFNVPGNPTNLNDLSNLQTVGNNFTIGTGADNNTSFAGSSLSFPNLTSVGNNLNVTNNPGITGVSMPNLAGTVNSIDVHTNGNAVATIDLSSVTAVTGAADFLNNVANATAANVNLGALTTVGGLLRLNRTAASINLTSLTSVGGNLVIDNNAGPLGTLNIPSLNQVGGTLSIDNNDITAINIPTAFTAPSTALTITGNTGLTSVTVGILSTTGNATVQNNGTGVTTINLSNLQTVGGNLSMNNNAANAITAAVDLSALTGVTGNMTLNRTLGTVTAPVLTNISGDFTANNNGTWTNLDASFPVLATVGGNLSLQNNSMLSTCCRLLCDIVVAGTKTISGNATGCATMANITSTCAGSECPSGFTRNTDPGECNYTSGGGEFDLTCPASTITYAYSGPGGFSGSGVSTLDALDFPVGTTTITATITTSSPVTTGTCTFTVTVNDNEPPVVTPGSIASCYPSILSAETAAIGATTATDNCGTPTKTASTSMSGCTATITVTATDGSGNTATTTYTTSIDNTPPTVTTGTIAACYPTVAAAEAAAIAATTATDACSTPTLTASTAGTCSATITVTATDACGNTASVTYTTSIDNTPPTVTAGTIAACYPTVAAAEAAAIAATTATDACSTPTLTASTAGTCSATITVTATDACGNTASVTYTTTIDGTPPTVTAGTIAACYFSIATAEAAAIAATTATDSCSTPTKTASTAMSGCTATITVTATDACGNTASVTYTTSIDITPPTMTAGTIAACYPTVAAAEAAAIAATTATDACSTPTLTASTAGTCSATITVIATDACGNTESVTYTTTIDGTPPTVTAGTIAACYPTVAAAEAAAIAATTATDACSTPTLTVSTAGTCSATITVTATDACGNAASVTYTTSIDNTPPTVTAGTIAACYPTVAAAEAAAIAATTATDACGTPTLTASTAGTCSATITVTATDACGNTASVTYTTSIDNTPPTVTAGTIAACYPTVAAAEAAAIAATTATDACSTPTLTASTAGTCSATITVTATDACGNTASVTYTTTIDGTPPTVTAGTIAACYFSIATAEAAAIAATTATDACSTPTKTASTVMSGCTATITVTATDACGNTASVTYTTSIDNTPPTVTAGTIAACYPTVAAAEAAAIAATTATDACGTPTLTASTAGTCSATITVTATDACGNTASVTYTTSIDGTAPTVTAGSIAACYPTVAAAEAAAIAATTATDACGTPTLTASTTGTCSATITVTATDACGNTASVTYTTSIDNTPPTVTAGTIAACYPTVAAAEAAAIAATTATDACGTPTLTASTTGTCSASITVTATDACGNSASVTYTTTIDGTPPTLTCPPTQMLILGPTCSATLPDYTGLATVMDNCALMSVTQAPAASTTVSGAGPLTVTLTATDNCGNTSTCTFTVNKVDITPPMVTCFPDTITFNGEPSITLNPMDLVTATDNCGIASITLSPSVILCSQLGQTVPVTVTVTDINSNVSTCTSNVFVDGLPCGWSHTSGSVGCNSTASYNTMTGVWTAGATNCFYGPSYNADAKAFVQRPLCGNGSITVRVTGINVLATGWAGIVMRDGNAQGAKKIQLMTNLSNFHRREVRTVTNGMATIQQFPANNRYWLRLVRQGNQFSGFISPDGVSWFFVMAANIDMPNCIQMGLVLTNYTPVGTTTATFDNVSTTGSLTPMMAPINAPIDLVGQEVELDFSVFPNPTEGQLNLDISKYLGRQVRVELYSAQGQLVKFSELDEVQQHVERMDISEQAAGMYIVRLKSPGVPDATKRVILSKMWRP